MENRKEQLKMIADFISKYKSLDKYEIWEYNTYYIQKKQLKSTEVPLEEGFIVQIENSTYLHEQQVVSGLIGNLLDRKLIVLVGKADDSLEDSMEEMMKFFIERPKGEIARFVVLFAVSIIILTSVFSLILEPLHNNMFLHLLVSMIFALITIGITAVIFKEINRRK